MLADRSPAAEASGHVWKMITSQGAYSSTEGLRWAKLPFKPVATGKSYMYMLNNGDVESQCR